MNVNGRFKHKRIGKILPPLLDSIRKCVSSILWPRWGMLATEAAIVGEGVEIDDILHFAILVVVNIKGHVGGIRQSSFVGVVIKKGHAVLQQNFTIHVIPSAATTEAIVFAVNIKGSADGIRQSSVVGVPN